MIRNFGVLCILFCLVAVTCTSGAVVQPGPDYGKILQIHVTYHGNSYSISSMKVNYGRSPSLDLRTGVLIGTILDPKGNVLNSFSIQEPGLAYGDLLAPNGGDGLTGYTTRSVDGETAITVPYLQGMKTFSLTDSRGGSILLLADLDAAMTQFCTSYPADPDCLVHTPSAPTTAPVAFPYLIQTVLFASILISAGLALVTTLRRSPGEVPEKETILVVDDEPGVVGMLKSVLGRKGYLIQTATSGKECLESLQKKIPDLILLDVMMEPMNGWQTLEQIRKNPGTKSVPVVMLTANQLTAAEAKKYQICIDDYIMKPWGPDELDSAVEYFLERKRKLKNALQLTSRAGVDKEKVCEFARLDRRLSANRKIVDILRFQRAKTEPKGTDALETLAVADHINFLNTVYEKQILKLRQEINSSLVSKGLPEFTW